MLGGGSHMQRGTYQTTWSGSRNERKNQSYPPSTTYSRILARSQNPNGASKHSGAHGSSHKMYSHTNQYQIPSRSATYSSHAQPRRSSNTSRPRNDFSTSQDDPYHLRHIPTRPDRSDLRSLARTHEMLKGTGWKDSQSRESAVYELYETIRRMDGSTIKHDRYGSSRTGRVPHASRDARRDSGVGFGSTSSTSQGTRYDSGVGFSSTSYTSREVPINMSMADLYDKPLYNKPLPALPKPGAVPKSRTYVETTKTANKTQGTHHTGSGVSGVLFPPYRLGSSSQGHKTTRSASQTVRPGYYQKPTTVAPAKAKAKAEYYQSSKEEYFKPAKTQQKLKASISRSSALVSSEGRYPTNIGVERGGVSGPAIASWPRSPVSRAPLSRTQSKLQKEKTMMKGKQSSKTGGHGSWRERITTTAGKLMSFSRKRSDSDGSFGCQGLSADYLAQVERARQRNRIQHAEQYADASEKIRQAFTNEPYLADKKGMLKKSYTDEGCVPAPLFSGPGGQYKRTGRWV